MPAPTTLLMPQRHVGGALPYLSSMGVDGAHNTVGEMSALTTLFGFCHARNVAVYCPAGAQSTVLGIAVDLSALPYFLRLFPSPYRAGIPGRLVLVGSDRVGRKRAVSRGLAHPQSETRVGVKSGVRPGLLVGEVVWRRARVPSECSGRRGGPESETGTIPPWPGLPVEEAVQRQAGDQSERFRFGEAGRS